MHKLHLLHALISLTWLFATAAQAVVTGSSNSDDIVSRVPPAFVATAGSPGEVTLGPGNGAGGTSAPFAFSNGGSVPWRIDYTPDVAGTPGGTVELRLGSGGSEVVLSQVVEQTFDALYIITRASEADTSAAVENIRLTDFDLATPGLTLLGRAVFASANGDIFEVLKISEVALLSGFELTGRTRLFFPALPLEPGALDFEVLAGDTAAILDYAIWGESWAQTSTLANGGGLVGSAGDLTVGRDASDPDGVRAGGNLLIDKNFQTAGSVIANGNVTIGENGSIGGDVIAGGSISLGAGTSVAGAILDMQPSPYTPPRLPAAQSIVAGGPNVTVAGSQTLPPGVYGSLLVTSGSTLTLMTGGYVFSSFDTSTTGNVLIDLSGGGDSVILIEGNVMLASDSSWGVSGGTAAQVFVETHGSVVVSTGSSFAGTLFAPFGPITIARDSTAIGALFSGVSVEMSRDTSLFYVLSPLFASRVLAGDADGDLIADEDDNCPIDANTDQQNSDADSRGDACDNCPFVDNEPQIDFDQDGVGDACDNCVTLSNPSQSDRELDEFGAVVGDTVGDACDNCPDTINPGQENTSFETEQGDACELATLCALGDGAFSGVCAPLVTGQAPSSWAPPVLATAIDWAAELLLPNVSFAQAAGGVELTLRCGAEDLVAANIGVRVPAGVTAIDYAGCDTADGANPAARLCDAGDPVGATVDATGSFTLGPQVVTVPGVAATAGAPDELFVVRLSGNPTLCNANSAPVVLGVVNTTGLGNNALEITDDGFDAFVPPLDTLVAPGGPVPSEEIQTISGPANPALTITVSPALDDVSGLVRSQITLTSDFLIQRIAFGLRGYAGAAMTFGACDTALGDANGTRTCAANPDLGPGINPGSTFTFTAGPNAPGGPGAFTLEGDTLYVALDGQFFQGISGFSLNNPGQQMLLGVVEYDAAGPRPTIVFDGAEQLLGTADPIIRSGGGSFTAAEVQLIGSGDGDEDFDGDMIGDDSDNCPRFPNFPQLNNGGVFTASADLIGDACQCGDFFGDGIAGEVQAVTAENDLEGCAAVLAGQVADPEAVARCSVTGGPSFDVLDLAVFDAAQQGLALPAGLGVEQVCAPAVEAATP